MDASGQTLLRGRFRDMPDPRLAGKVAPKRHDILVSTVIPKFLEMLQLRDATVTIYPS